MRGVVLLYVHAYALLAISGVQYSQSVLLRI
jgi:hypothetical protein